MESPPHDKIYHTQAQRYEQLVAREDYQGNILPALRETYNFERRIVVDLGTGTGRLLKLLAPQASVVYGFDRSPAMLAVAQQETAHLPNGCCSLAVADHRHLPLASNSCDMIISGWSLCYVALHTGPEWREALRDTLRRMRHIVHPDGAIVILETMGTGFTMPNPPSFMLDYFDYLAGIGMQSRWIRTDYRFSSPQEAVDLTRFFFGDELAELVEQAGSPIVPECTAIWWTNDAAVLRLDA